ncbi:MAG: MaoC family dehydratase N-terminal domain-containing protein [Actinomycetota bacterium]
MKESMKGQTLFEVERTIDPLKLEELSTALATESAGETATLVPFFGPTIPGEQLFVELLEMDLSRALLGGISYQWTRPFQPGEKVSVKVFVEDLYDKGNLQFVIVTSEFRGGDGDVIQTHKATFIERGAA